MALQIEHCYQPLGVTLSGLRQEAGFCFGEGGEDGWGESGEFCTLELDWDKEEARRKGLLEHKLLSAEIFFYFLDETRRELWGGRCGCVGRRSAELCGVVFGFG